LFFEAVVHKRRAAVVIFFEKHVVRRLAIEVICETFVHGVLLLFARIIHVFFDADLIDAVVANLAILFRESGVPTFIGQ
jgi:hypothetical protein